MLMFYGSEINGLVSSISQFIAYFNLVEAGLSGAAVYALYKPLADNDHKAINGVVSAANKFYIQAGYIFISLTIGLAVLYPIFVKTGALPPLNVGLLVLILGVNGALEFFTMAKFRVLLTADQKAYVTSLASIAHIALNTIILVKHPFDPYPFVFLNLILSCLAAIQAPIIMMSQNRQSQKDRLTVSNDFLVNLKSEIIVEHMHYKLDELLETKTVDEIKDLYRQIEEITKTQKIILEKIESAFSAKEK
jgi:hypothetical protein